MKHHGQPTKYNLGRAVKKGVLWTLTGRGVLTVADIAFTILLARLLEPEQFGTFGIAMIFIGLANRFGNVGFVLALLQRKEIREEHISSVFVTNLVIFSLIAGSFIWASPLIGRFFNNPLAGQVAAIGSIVFFTHAFSSIARMLLQRQMNFKMPAIAAVVDHLAGSLITVGFAWAGHGAWSLMYGHVLGSAISAVLLVLWSGWVPRLRYSHAAMKDIYAFGLGVLLKNLVIYGSDRIDYLIIGKQLGPTALGLYEKAFRIMDTGAKEMSSKIGAGVLFSAFSRLQDDKARLRAAYSKVVMTLSLICFPAFFGLFLVAPSFVYVLFGEKWLPTVIPLQILCIAGLLRVHLNITSGVITAIGKVAVEVIMRGLAFALLTIGCWIGSFWGIIGVTVAVTVTTAILTVVIVSYLGSLTGLSWKDFLLPQQSALWASLFMSAIVLAYQRSSEPALGIYSVPMLMSSTAVGLISYITGLLILRPPTVVSLFKELTADVKLVFHKTTQ
jgi:O-antigen/teichoic acid export membrane protein